MFWFTNFISKTKKNPSINYFKKTSHSVINVDSRYICLDCHNFYLGCKLDTNF